MTSDMFTEAKALCELLKCFGGEVKMSCLIKRSRNHQKITLAVSAAILSLFAFETFMILIKKSNLELSIVVSLMGALFVFALHFFYLRERKFLINKLMANLLKEKPNHLDLTSLKILLEKDFVPYLKQSYVFVTQLAFRQSEFNRVEGLTHFVKHYKSHTDLKLLDQFTTEILENNKKTNFFSDFSWKVLVGELFLFTSPMGLFFLSEEKKLSSFLLVTAFLAIRFFSACFYLFKFKMNFKESPSFNKINHFLYGEFEDEVKLSTRISLDKLEESGADHTVFLIDHSRKAEVENLIRSQTSGESFFKNWSVISKENSVYKNKVKASCAFILYPSEMQFSFNEMQDFIGAFTKVIIVDASPAYALPETSVFYLDHNQEIKEVFVGGNLDRLSGDKGLILRNLKHKGLDCFLEKIEQRILSDESFFLVYEDAENLAHPEQGFVCPPGLKAVTAKRKMEGQFSGHYCDLGEGSLQEKLEKAQVFLANCIYHKLFSKAILQQSLKKSFRAS